MKTTDTLVQLNIEHLKQGLSMLDSISDETYTAARPPVFNSGIGEHIRHCVEHYETFLAGLESGSIDYDARRRDLSLSESRFAAAEKIRTVIAGLEAVETKDAPLEVKLAASHFADRDDPISSSTVKRELQYLQAHTIHHYALIAMILRLQEVDVPDDFGVAPSTLQYRMSADEA